MFIEMDAATSAPPVRDPISLGSLSIAQSFSSYQPILRRYPQLNPSTLPDSFPQFSIQTTPQAFNSKPLTESSLAQLEILDRPLLSSIILTRCIQRDPNAVMCRAEVGGGRCADPTCGDVHLDKGDPEGESLCELACMESVVGSEVDWLRWACRRRLGGVYRECHE